MYTYITYLRNIPNHGSILPPKKKDLRIFSYFNNVQAIEDLENLSISPKG